MAKTEKGVPVDIEGDINAAFESGHVSSAAPLTAHGIQVLSHYYPLVRSEGDLDSFCRLLKGENEMGFSPFFYPKLVDACCKRGIFPLTLNVGNDVYIFAPKLHFKRSISALATDASEVRNIAGFPRRADGGGLFNEDSLQVSKKLLRHPDSEKRTPALVVYVNRKEDLGDVFQMIHRQHGENWLCSELRKCLLFMFAHPDDFETKIIVTAVRRQKYEGSCEGIEAENVIPEGALVAGEIGFLIGDIYTSATGAYDLSGAGVLQLALTGVLMRKAGCKVWDLGMHMAYKENLLHCIEVKRDKWLQMTKEHLSFVGSIDKDFLLSLSNGLPVSEVLLRSSSLNEADNYHTSTASKSQLKKAQRLECRKQLKEKRKKHKAAVS